MRPVRNRTLPRLLLAWAELGLIRRTISIRGRLLDPARRQQDIPKVVVRFLKIRMGAQGGLELLDRFGKRPSGQGHSKIASRRAVVRVEPQRRLILAHPVGDPAILTRALPRLPWATEK